MKNRRWWKLAAVTVLAAGVLLSGCTEAAKSPLSDRKKDELILALGSEPESGFDPTAGWGRYGSPLFQSTLFKRDNDLNIDNDLATAMEVTGGGTVWTIRIRQDATFSDGKPVTAEDVKFTFETAAGSGSAIDLTIMKSVEAKGTDTVVFTLTEPRSTFVSMLASIGIVPKHAYGQNYAQHPIGSGPYRFVQWDKGQQLIVEANPDYYGEKPIFKRLTILFMSDDAAFAAAKAGRAHIAAIPSALGKQSVPGMKLEAVRTVDNRGIAFPYVASGERTKEGNPIGNDVTADPAIRKTVNTAIDRNALVQGVLNGFGSPAYTANDKLPWWNESSVIRDADIQEARAILEKGGWKLKDGDGVAQKGSLKAEFTLLYPAGDVTRQSLALAAADMVKPAGINMLT